MKISCRLCCVQTLLLLVVALLLIALPVHAADVYVTDDFPTIQSAVNAVSDLDRVIVRNGTYTGPGNYDIDTLGKAVTVMAENGPTDCKIDCNGLGRAFLVQSGEDNGTVIEGFRIIGGVAIDPFWPATPNEPFDTAGYGGAILCQGSGSNINNCIITDCTADYGGGAIFANAGSDPCITGSVISYNFCGSGVYDINQLGGAIYCRKSTITVTDCNIEKNEADGPGGGIAAQDSDVTVIDCEIFDNQCYAFEDEIFQHGGGLYFGGNGNLVLSNSRLVENLANDSGGAVAVKGGSASDSALITDCEILDNVCYAGGGGIFLQGPRNMLVKNCIIANNWGYWIGGISITDSAPNNVPTIDNCTIASNGVPWQCKPYPLPDPLVGGIEWWYDGRATIRNSIIWGNKALQVRGLQDTDPNTIQYSDVQMIDPNGCIVDTDPTHIWPGIGNINADPCFANPIRRDYHLMTTEENGRYNPQTHAFDQTDPFTSPCINAGDPDPILVGSEPEPNGNRLNMGAYGGTTQASKSTIVRAVFGTDLDVDLVDFALLAETWQTQVPPGHPADVDHDGTVGSRDLAALAEFWLWYGQ